VAVRKLKVDTLGADAITVSPAGAGAVGNDSVSTRTADRGLSGIEPPSLLKATRTAGTAQ
jgi:hypothetical protein